MEQTLTLDTAPLNGFHKRAAVYTTGGMFCDGYILGIIGIALAILAPQMNLGPIWEGLIGSSALIGIFVGSLIFGWITDLIGRQKAYVIDLIVFIVGSILQLFVADPAELFVLRLIMGIAIGADYAIGASLLSEFLPKKERGTLLACLNAIWTVGFVAAIIVGFIMQKYGGDDIWRWMLASSAIPAIIVLFLRMGTPESPRWLIKQGRVEEARKIVKDYIGPNVGIDDLLDENGIKTNYLKIFSKKWRKRTAFGGLFWFCQVAPYFALLTFEPEILKQLNIGEGFLGTLIINLFLLVGAAFGVWIMNKLPRRVFVIYSFAILTLALFVLGVWPTPPMTVIILCFGVYTFLTTAAGNLESVYPSEMFPTDIRSTGVGFSAAVSRIGAAAGTFLLPIGLSQIGLGPSLLIGAAILLFGCIISVAWAPETRTLTLNEASSGSVILSNHQN